MTNKIIDAISTALYQEFGDEYEYYKEDLPQGLAEPCFFIRLVESDFAPETIGHKRKGHSIDIHYFPTEGRKNSEMFDVADAVLWLLEIITLSDGTKLRGLDKQYSIVDDVLHVTVSYAAHVKLPDQEGDYMEELEQTITDKEGTDGD